MAVIARHSKRRLSEQAVLGCPNGSASGLSPPLGEGHPFPFADHCPHEEELGLFPGCWQREVGPSARLCRLRTAPAPGAPPQRLCQGRHGNGIMDLPLFGPRGRIEARCKICRSLNSFQVMARVSGSKLMRRQR